MKLNVKKLSSILLGDHNAIHLCGTELNNTGTMMLSITCFNNVSGDNSLCKKKKRVNTQECINLSVIIILMH